MAQYTYKCCSCTWEFDIIIQPKYRDAWQICPRCKGDSARIKIPTNTTFDLHGKGFCNQGMPKRFN